jgi:hypothetical protein
MDEDLNMLFEYDEVALMPRLQPRYWPFAPLHAPNFQVYTCNAFMHRPFTTLNTYVAPPPPRWVQDYGQTKAIAGNGIVTWGNAPTRGVYTGVKEE